jgi:hypothetical protein
MSYALYDPTIISLLGTKSGEWSYANYALAQALIWGYTAGCSAEEIAEIVDIVMKETSGTWGDGTSKWNGSYDTIAMVNKAITYEDRIHKTIYLWEADGTVQRMLSVETGVAVVPEYDDVTGKGVYDAIDYISLTIAKTDEDTGKPLSGVTFDVYKDGNKVATVTTGTDGKKTLTLKTKYSATAEVTKEYCSNYGQLSEKNKALVDADYYSKSDALVAANAEALAAAKKAAEVNFATKHTYKVVETATKTAYYLNPNSTTKSTSYSSGDGNGTITFSFTNKRQLGSITITKKDAMTNNLLEGAIYGLYANENINILMEIREFFMQKMHWWLSSLLQIKMVRLH